MDYCSFHGHNHFLYTPDFRSSGPVVQTVDCVYTEMLIRLRQAVNTGLQPEMIGQGKSLIGHSGLHPGIK